MRVFLLAVLLAASTVAAQPRAKIMHMKPVWPIVVPSCISPSLYPLFPVPGAAVYAYADTECPSAALWQRIPDNLNPAYFRLMHVPSGLYLTRTNTIVLRNFAEGPLDTIFLDPSGPYMARDQLFRIFNQPGAPTPPQVAIELFQVSPNDPVRLLSVNAQSRLTFSVMGLQPNVHETFFAGQPMPSPLW